MNEIKQHGWRSHYLKTYAAEFEDEFEDSSEAARDLGKYARSIGADEASAYLRAIAHLLGRCAMSAKLLQNLETAATETTSAHKGACERQQLRGPRSKLSPAPEFRRNSSQDLMVADHERD